MVSQAPFVSVLVSSCICISRIILRVPDNQTLPFPRSWENPSNVLFLCRMGPRTDVAVLLQAQRWGYMDWTPRIGEDGLPGTLPTQQASTVSAWCSDASQLPEGCFGFCYPSHVLQMGNQVTCSKPHGQYLPKFEIKSIHLKCFDGYTSSLSFAGWVVSPRWGKG